MRGMFLFWGSALIACQFSGCGWVAQGKFDALQSQTRILNEQNKSQLAEIENLKVHSRNIEDQLIRAEQQLVQTDSKNVSPVQLSATSNKTGLTPSRPFVSGISVPSDATGTLAEWARRYPHLMYDPSTNIAKFDTDVIFGSGETQLKPEAERKVREFAKLMQSPEARHLKVMVVGHTDDAGLKGRELRSKYSNNWQLSASRAVAVVDKLRDAGLPPERLGIAGYAENQPISPNDTADSRGRNRRVEIFVVGPETPVVGWSETHTSVYR